MFPFARRTCHNYRRRCLLSFHLVLHLVSRKLSIALLACHNDYLHFRCSFRTFSLTTGVNPYQDNSNTFARSRQFFACPYRSLRTLPKLL
ncbi:hypothetical protein DFS34DRAFT_634075 [Phlyctochytrium arcticum]|nr:hypothetical protein DFS34DRAFT_634075 [Phlyctochytrium arcticum]